MGFAPSVLLPGKRQCTACEDYNQLAQFTTKLPLGSTATTSIRPYTTSTNTGATYVAYFGAYQRNTSTKSTPPSLTCTKSSADRYSTDTASGGNGQLNSPVALLTADEASFAGSGTATDPWVVSPPPPPTMQSVTSSELNSMMPNTGDTVTLEDGRDGQSYSIAKLADGKFWMTQNLDHNIVTTENYYTPANTDITANWTPSTATSPSDTTTWSSSGTTPVSHDAGNFYLNPDIMAYNEGRGEEPADIIVSDVTLSNSHYHLGNYYNWTAAVAMNDSSSYTTKYQDVNQSICPANWTLPKSGNVTTSGSFQYLVTQYGWDSSTQKMVNPNIWNTPIKTALVGSWYGSLDDVGESGNYWSSVVYGSGIAYNLLAYYSGDVYPSDYYYRNYGYSVRCVAR